MVESSDIAPRIWLIAGPTASGKSAHALQLAEWTGAEIVNADSMQIYAGLRILTAGPSPEERAKAPHHLFEVADAAHPFRLATSPARSFLNSSFNETPSSRAKEQNGRPEVMIHPEDAASHGIPDGGRVRLGNRRGAVILHARHFDGLRRGVLVSEGIWPNSAFPDGNGINSLTGADPIAPFGGAAVHDNRVWIEAVPE